MEGIWTVGPFIIKQAWLVLAILFIVGLFLSKHLITNQQSSKELRDVYWNSLLYFFIAFSFSSILVYPMITLRDPIAVLAMPSGSTEWMIACGVMFLYVIWVTRKKCVHKMVIFLHILISYLVLETMYFSFNPFSSDGHPVSFFQLILNLFLLIFFVIQQQKNVSIHFITIRLTVLYGMMVGFLSLIFEVRMFDAVVPSWFYFLIVAAGLVGTKKKIIVKEQHDTKKTKKSFFILLVLICIVGWGSFNSLASTKISEDSQLSSRVAVGQMAPDFTLQTVEGEKVALSDFLGQPIMINFWATWCPPCRAEMPDMQRFYTNHDVVILAINGTNTEGSREQVKQFADDLGLTFPILLDEAGETYALYQIGPRPTSLFIDKSGMITHIHIGPMNVEMMIRQLKGMPEM